LYFKQAAAERQGQDDVGVGARMAHKAFDGTVTRYPNTMKITVTHTHILQRIDIVRTDWYNEHLQLSQTHSAGMKAIAG